MQSSLRRESSIEKLKCNFANSLNELKSPQENINGLVNDDVWDMAASYGYNDANYDS